MSYSVWLEIDTGDYEPARIEEAMEITDHCCEVLRLAFGNRMEDLDGKLAADMDGEFLRAAEKIEGNPAIYQEINPNCSVEYTALFLRTVSSLCSRHPKCTLRIC